MKLKAYQATDGDCLLLSSATGDSHILVDGGRKTSFREHTAADLSSLERLDLVVVSHIDNDHISGIVELFDAMVDWEVHDFHEQQGSATPAELRRLLPDETERPRPPQVAEVWHNAFQDQINHETAVPFAQSQIDDVLSAAMRMQLLDERFSEVLEQTAKIAQGVKDAVILRNRLSPSQLDIPVNRPAGEKELMFIADDPNALPYRGTVQIQPLDVGAFSVRLLGPSRDDLEKLAEEWQEWVRDNAAVAEELRREAQRESERLDRGESLAMSAVFGALSARLGDGKSVTVPNLASLLMWIEDDEHSLLLTGDGNASEVLRGLRARTAN